MLHTLFEYLRLHFKDNGFLRCLFFAHKTVKHKLCMHQCVEHCVNKLSFHISNKFIRCNRIVNSSKSLKWIQLEFILKLFTMFELGISFFYIVRWYPWVLVILAVLSFEYLCSIWGSVSNCFLKPLQVLQNRGLKCIFNLTHQHPSVELYDLCKILPIKGIYITSNYVAL